MAFEAIGEQLGITENAARMRYRHALPRLARKVRDLRMGLLEQTIAPV